VIEPGTPLLWNWHLDLICEHLEAVTYGECQSLAINIPPRYMKSILVTVMWPCWEWAVAPSKRYLFASYAGELSTSHSLSRRRILESEWYRRGVEHYWGEPWELADDANLKTRYQNTAQGHMIATSVGGSATGEGGDRVVIDDPLKPTEAVSEAQRATANRFWDETLSTRLNDKQFGAFVIVMQRLHQSDMTGHVLQEGGWTHLSLPAIAERDEDIVFPRSGRTHHRDAGELLWPERENAEQIERVKKRLGSYGFAGQYQQRPTPAEGGLIKREWIRFWVSELQSDDDPAKVVQLPSNLQGHRQSWDMGLWGRTRDDYTVGLVGARLGGNAYVLDGDRRRLDLPGCVSSVKAMTAKWPQAARKVVENAANGSEVVRRLRTLIPGLVPLPPRGDKEARLVNVSPFFESGNVFFPHPREAGWVADCLEELYGFPFAEHDDFVDALSQLINDFNLNAVTDGGAGMSGSRSTPEPTRPGGTADVGIVRKVQDDD
jgi:predicted phage terminase large subunit-like protein